METNSNRLCSFILNNSVLLGRDFKLNVLEIMEKKRVFLVVAIIFVLLQSCEDPHNNKFEVKKVEKWGDSCRVYYRTIEGIYQGGWMKCECGEYAVGDILELTPTN